MRVLFYIATKEHKNHDYMKLRLNVKWNLFSTKKSHGRIYRILFMLSPNNITQEFDGNFIISHYNK